MGAGFARTRPAAPRFGTNGGRGAGREVGNAAGRKRDHERNRTRRPRFLRPQPIPPKPKSSRGQRKPKRQLQELPAACHGLLLVRGGLTFKPQHRGYTVLFVGYDLIRTEELAS